MSDRDWRLAFTPESLNDASVDVIAMVAAEMQTQLVIGGVDALDERSSEVCFIDSMSAPCSVWRRGSAT